MKNLDAKVLMNKKVDINELINNITNQIYSHHKNCGLLKIHSMKFYDCKNRVKEIIDFFRKQNFNLYELNEFVFYGYHWNVYNDSNKNSKDIRDLLTFSKEHGIERFLKFQNGHFYNGFDYTDVTMELADDSDDRRIIFNFFNSIEWNDFFNQNIIKKYFVGDIKKFKKALEKSSNYYKNSFKEIMYESINEILDKHPNGKQIYSFLFDGLI